MASSRGYTREDLLERMARLHVNLARIGVMPLIDLQAAHVLDDDQLAKAVAVVAQQLVDAANAIERA